MRTVGTLLKEERLRKGFSIAQVEKATKIRGKFIEAIEQDDYKKMPALPYVQGFIKNYSNFLGLRSTTILAIFRRQYIQKERAKDASIEEPLTGRQWQLTTNKVIVALVVVLVLGLFSYFFVQYQALHAPPPLTLESPKGDEVVAEEQIPVFGNTDPDATLTINTEPVLVKEDGRFYKDIPIQVGMNTIAVEATSRVGEKTMTIRKITRTSSQQEQDSQLDN